MKQLLAAWLFAAMASQAFASKIILKPEPLADLAKRLGYESVDAALADYLLFIERIQAGFATREWIENCKLERHPSLCAIIEDYFEFIRKGGPPKAPGPRSPVKKLGRITSQNIGKYQGESFQSLLNALPNNQKANLLSLANEAVKSSACPQNLSLALAHELEELAGDSKQFVLLEKLYLAGLNCSKPNDSWYELTHLRMALIYLAVKRDKDAIPLFKKALLAESPREDYRSLYWLAHLLRKTNDPEAEKYFSSLLERYPRSWYSILLLHERGLDPLKMSMRDKETPDLYALKDKGLDHKFIWLKLGLLLEKDSYKLKKYAEYITELITPDIEFGYIQHIARLLHSADLYKAQISIVTKYLSLTNAPITIELLEYLYPAPYTELFNLHGVELDTAILLGLARQESSFDVNAKSSANARGLLQLLPSTARLMGSKKSSKLWSASENIRYASKYLLGLSKRFHNSLEKSFAAYNAGPGRVETWEKDFAFATDPMVFLDLIPYRETRDYVPTILRNAYWYHRLYPGVLNVTKKSYTTSSLLKALIQGSSVTSKK